MKKTPFLFSLTTLISFFIFSCFILSCKKDSITNKEQETLSESLQSYIQEDITLSIKIKEQFSKADKILRSAEFRNSITAAKNENELKKTLENAGIENSHVIILLLRKKRLNANNFNKENPEFSKLEIKKRNELVNLEFDRVFDKLSNNENKLITERLPSCVTAYQTGVRRCNRNYLTCGVFAGIGFFISPVGGLLAAMYCVVQLSHCSADARDDYLICK